MGKLSENAEHRDLKIELLVIFAILISLGFPGTYAWVWGSKSGIMMGYAAFFIEIFAMVLSSGENWLSVQVVSLDKKYSMLYILAVVLLVESMLVTNAPSLQFITSIRLCVTLLFAIWMQEYFSFRRMVEMICIAQTIFVLLVLVFMLRYPWMAFEDNGAFIGLYPSKNSFASELSFGIACMAFLIREKRKNLRILKDGCLFLLYKS